MIEIYVTDAVQILKHMPKRERLETLRSFLEDSISLFEDEIRHLVSEVVADLIVKYGDTVAYPELSHVKDFWNMPEAKAHAEESLPLIERSVWLDLDPEPTDEELYSFKLVASAWETAYQAHMEGKESD